MTVYVVGKSTFEVHVFANTVPWLVAVCTDGFLGTIIIDM
jgi:hypothetical protein